MTTTPAASSPANMPGRGPAWLVLTASERGASHIATKAPNQDAVATERAGAHGVVAAVADGHGHSRHLRSDRGSRLAVKIGCQVAQELADRIAGGTSRAAAPDAQPDAQVTAGVMTELVEEFLVPAIVERWREAVLADVSADPFTDEEQDQRHKGDDATIAYGSTLLLGVALSDWLILAQIGDGDVVGVRTNGREMQPVPADPLLDGLVTTSLCGPDPRSDFRVAVVDTSGTPLLAVLLATDGYGNAQVVEQWPRAFSEDLAWMLRDRDTQWLASQLPSWTARCASSEGSADDTTVALMLSPAAASTPAGRPGGPGSQDPEVGSEETTIPAVPHADTIPSGHVPSGHHPIEPVTIRLKSVTSAPEPAQTASGTDEIAAADGAQDTAAAANPAEHTAAASSTDDTAAASPSRTDEIAAANGAQEVDISDQVTAHWEPPASAAGMGAR